MLHIIWLIIKTIGIVFLILLGIVVLLLLLGLLVPVRYEVLASYQGKPSGKVRVTWLLHLFSLQVEYKDVWKAGVRILGFPVTYTKKTKIGAGIESIEKEAERELEKELEKELKNEPEGELENETESCQNASSMQENQDEVFIEEPEQKEENIVQEEAVLKEEKSLENETLQEESERETENQKEKLPPNPLYTLWNRIKIWILGAKERLIRKARAFLHVWEAKKRLLLKVYDFVRSEENQATCFLLARQGKRMFLHVIPRKIQGNVMFGFEDPAKTGEILAMAAMLYPFYKDQLQITPVFDRNVFEGEVSGKGYIRFGTLLLLVLRLFFDRNLRKIVKQLFV